MSALDEIVGYLARVTFEDIPGTTVERQKELVVDTLGVAAAGVRAPGVKDVLELVKDSGGKAESTLLLDGAKVPCFSATLANTFMMHALDFDLVAGRVGVLAKHAAPVVELDDASVQVVEAINFSNRVMDQ